MLASPIFAPRTLGWAQVRKETLGSSRHCHFRLGDVFLGEVFLGSMKQLSYETLVHETRQLDSAEKHRRKEKVPLSKRRFSLSNKISGCLKFSYYLSALTETRPDKVVALFTCGACNGGWSPSTSSNSYDKGREGLDFKYDQVMLGSLSAGDLLLYEPAGFIHTLTEVTLMPLLHCTTNVSFVCSF